MLRMLVGIFWRFMVVMLSWLLVFVVFSWFCSIFFCDLLLWCWLKGLWCKLKLKLLLVGIRGGFLGRLFLSLENVCCEVVVCFVVFVLVICLCRVDEVLWYVCLGVEFLEFVVSVVFFDIIELLDRCVFLFEVVEDICDVEEVFLVVLVGGCLWSVGVDGFFISLFIDCCFFKLVVMVFVLNCDMVIFGVCFLGLGVWVWGKEMVDGDLIL